MVAIQLKLKLLVSRSLVIVLMLNNSPVSLISWLKNKFIVNLNIK